MSHAFIFPDSILVRTYEDRTDLWRILIFGPQGTPYQDAPFMIDWLLPSDFPHSPPKAHFHSWTNGKGRGRPHIFASAYMLHIHITLLFSKSVNISNALYTFMD